MKYLMLISIALMGLGCAKGSDSSAVAGEKFVQPTTTQQAYDQLIGKTFNGSNGNVFRFKVDGSIEATYTGLSTETYMGSNVQKTFTCQVTATSFTVERINTPAFGSFHIKLINPTEIKVGVPGSAITVWNCYNTVSGEMQLKRNSDSGLRHDLHSYQAVTAPTGQGYYEGNGTEAYTKQ